MFKTRYPRSVWRQVLVICAWPWNIGWMVRNLTTGTERAASRPLQGYLSLEVCHLDDNMPVLYLFRRACSFSPVEVRTGSRRAHCSMRELGCVG